MPPSEEQRRLYRNVRYHLETSMAPADAEEATDLLDHLIEQCRVDAFRDYADELDCRTDRAQHQELITALRKQATRLNCLDTELCTVQDPCFRCGNDI